MEHGYYSYKLNKPFKTLEDLQAEEDKVLNKAKQEQKLKEERAKDAEEIKQLMKKREELTVEINTKIDKFVEKYKTYHYTLRSTYDPKTNLLNTVLNFL